MRPVEKWMLIGAWMAMAAAAVFPLYKVAQSPRIDPSVTRLTQELERLQKGPLTNPPGPVPRWDWTAYFGPVATARPADPRAGSLTSDPIGHPQAHPVVVVKVLPFPVVGAVQATLDGASLSWSTQDVPVELKYWMKRVTAKPSGFSIVRQTGDRMPVKIADLGPDARSYIDLSTEPRQTYLYWVILTGQETDRSGDTVDLLPISNRSDRPGTATSPSATRLRLVGGAPTHAVLQVDTYDRAKKTWVSKTVLATPGESVAGTGWTLKGLRFNQFSVLADVTDEDGAARVLTTKN